MNQQPPPEAKTEPPPEQGAAYPISPDEDSGGAGMPDGGTSQTLMRLLRRHPLTELYRETAERPRPIREWVCFWGDALLLLITYALLLGIILIVAAKVLSPVPDLWPF